MKRLFTAALAVTMCFSLFTPQADAGILKGVRRATAGAARFVRRPFKRSKARAPRACSGGSCKY